MRWVGGTARGILTNLRQPRGPVASCRCCVASDVGPQACLFHGQANKQGLSGDSLATV